MNKMTYKFNMKNSIIKMIVCSKNISRNKV